MPLYRALRDIEIAAGHRLIPKGQEPFRAHLRFPIVFPITFGETEEHAVRDHQWGGQFSTRGISCTTNWSVALKYASKLKIVVRIDEVACERLGVRLFRVKDHVPAALILHPEDEEVVLVYNGEGAFPEEVVVEVFDVSKKENSFRFEVRQK